MSTIFISSTYKDLADHRRALTEILTRMKRHFSAMEYFGSRTDEARPTCAAEIDTCSIFVGVYAWRYGWVPPNSTTSITEQEFDYARMQKKPCLCYVVDGEHPWLPAHIDTGEKAQALEGLKDKVSDLVRSTFNTPDNLAKQVAADVAREFAPPRDDDTVGGLLQLNWDRFAPELQLIVLEAYKRAKEASSHGVVSTRHVIAAMEALPNSSGILFRAMPEEVIDEIRNDSRPPKAGDDSLALAQAFEHEQPFSHCVLGSLRRLLPSHSSNQRLLAIEVAVDILKNGGGNSVEKFRRAGIDGRAVGQLVRHTTQLAGDVALIRKALDTFDDAQIALLAYAIGSSCDSELHGVGLRDALLRDANRQGKMEVLTGEIMRRNPSLIR